MAISASNVNRQSEVMVVSSDSGPPRLDLALTRRRRGTFDSFDSSGEPSLYPRTARSSNDLFAQALSRIETADSDSEWGAVRAQARENNDRQGMADLIHFLRTTSPPPPPALQFPDQPSVFEENDTEPLQERESDRWRLLKKLRRPRTRARSESPARRPRTAGLPNSAVASKTASGNSHIAISIPLEYCHVGPDSDWALAIFNATPPLLPPTPPVQGDEQTENAAPGPYDSDRNVTVLKTVSEKGSISTLNTVNTMSSRSQRNRKGPKGSVSIWPKINPTPMSPPRTPYTTPPGSLRGKKPSVSKKRRDRPPMPPPQCAELPASPVIMPQSPDEGLDTSWPDQALSPDQQNSKAKKSPSRRPENITLPPRRSSIKVVRRKADTAPSSIDGAIGGASKRQSVTFDGPQLSPGYSEVPSLSPSIATTELSEPVVTNARSAKAYATASVILQEQPSITPRQSLSTRPGSSDTTQTTLVNESVASRNPSTRTAASRQSRRDRVKSLKQRDMEALRALTKQATHDDDGELTPRPRTSETTISSLRLPSRDGTFGSKDTIQVRGIETKLSATNLANMAKSQDTTSSNCPNGTSAKISDWQATQRAETPGWETAEEELTPGWETAREETPTPDWLTTSMATGTSESSRLSAERTLARDSTTSSGPPRRWGSYHRTSWASSVPLLDRIGSFAPSDESVTQIGEAVGEYPSPPRPTRMSRADSATLSQIDSDRLTSPRASLVDLNVQLTRSETDQLISGSIAAFPKPGSGARLSAIMPVAEVVPTDERWSASTLNSPMTVVEVSHPPFASSQVSGQSSTPLARPHTAGNANPELFNTATNSTSESSLRRRQQTTDDGDADDTATLRPKSRSRDDGPPSFLTMSALELRSHYATLRNAQVNDLAHEMLLNQERLEMRMHQQERNQMLFIERLERCMHDLRSLPGSPFLTSRPLDWPLDDSDSDFIYEEQRISRDARHDVRVRRTGRLPARPQHQQHHSEPSYRRPRRRIDQSPEGFEDFDGDFLDHHAREHRRQRRPSSSHNARPSRRDGAPGRSRHHTAHALPPLLTRAGLHSMDPLIRELQLAARVSQETARTVRTPQPGDPDDYYYNMI